MCLLNEWKKFNLPRVYHLPYAELQKLKKKKKKEKKKLKHLKSNGKGNMQILERCCHCGTDSHEDGEEGMLGCSLSSLSVVKSSVRL